MRFSFFSNNQPVNGHVMNMKIRANSYCTEQVFGFLDVWGQSLDVSVLQYVLKKMQLYISFLLF